MYSPTGLNTFIQNCPQALDFYLARRQSEALTQNEYDIEGPHMAEVGIAFHACVHAAALARKEDRPAFPAIEATALALSKKMDPRRAYTGREMANEFLGWWNFPEKFNFEHGVAWDRAWRPVAWDSPDRMLRLIFDSVGEQVTDDDNYGALRIAVAQDYKTGFGVREDELDSIQQDAYLASMRKMFPDADGYRIEVIATRFRRVYSKTFYLGQEDDVAEFNSRLQRLNFWIKAADISDRKPRIGTGCMACNFTRDCSAFAASVARLRENNVETSASPEALGRDLAVLTARTNEIEAILRAHAEAHGPIAIDQKLLGFHVSEERAVKDPLALLEVFFKACTVPFSDDQKAALRGLVGAIDPGVTAYERVVGALARALGYKTKKSAVEVEGARDLKVASKPKWGWKKGEAKVG